MGREFTNEWGFFTPVPEVVIEAALEIGTDAVFLFSYLMYRKNKERGVAWPSYDRMQKDFGWGRTRIKKAIDALEDARFLEKTRRYGRSTIYNLVRPPDVGGPSDSSPAPRLLGDPVVSERDQSSREARLSVVPERDLTQDSDTQELNRPKGAAFNKIRKEAEDIFASTFKRKPLPKKHPQGSTWWWQPIMRMLDRVEWSIDQYTVVLNDALAKLSNGVTIKGPISVEGTFYAIIDEMEDGGFTPQERFQQWMDNQ